MGGLALSGGGGGKVSCCGEIRLYYNTKKTDRESARGEMHTECERVMSNCL